MPLRLKSLELHGYKTFATRTEFEFASGITAIVGPNGSGKSNIADALRWVLGEQSYLLLRGKKTEDMIFSGSEHRSRAGMASAEIVFDNSAGWLPVDFAEVAVARRAYRDGHNEYLLNGQQVRLRDMNELLAASGLSERTYTILGQGLVDASLALKADERRRLFEEAAGVGLYRVRREEALKRLENTERNLERVQDIMAEVGPRLKTLERQARRANEFGGAQADLRAVLLEWYGYHWHSAEQALTKARAQEANEEARVAEAREAHLKKQGEYSQFRERLNELRAKLAAWQRQSSDLHTRRESVSLDLAVLDERRRSLEALRSSLVSEHEAAASDGELARQRFADLEQEAARLQAELDEAGVGLQNAQQALQARQSERTAIENQLQAARSMMDSLQGKKAETQARHDELTARLESLRHKFEAGRQTIDSVEAELKKAEQTHVGATEARQKFEARLELASYDLDESQERVRRQDEARSKLLEERTSDQARQSRLQAQRQVLEEAEESLAGYAEGARFLLDAMRQSRLRGSGALSAALDVPPELETAIGAALGDIVDAVLLDDQDLEDALRLLESEDAGRAALLPLNGHFRQPPNAPSDEDLLGSASHLVNSAPDMRGAVDLVLGDTLVVRTRAAARRLVGQIPRHGRVVTLRGEVFRGDGVIIAGKSAASSTLGRPRQKRELNESLAELTARLQALEAALEAAAQGVKSAQEEQAAREQYARQARLEAEQAIAAQQKTALDVENTRRQFEWRKSQRAELHREMSEAEDEREQLATLVKEAAETALRAQDDIRAASGRLSSISLEEAQEQVGEWNTRLAVAQEALNSVQARKAERQQTLERFRSEVQDSEARLSETESSLQRLDSEQAALRERQGGLNRQIDELRVQIEPTETDLERAEQEENRLQQVEVEAQTALSGAERGASQAQIEVVRRQEAVDSLRDKMVDDFGLVSSEAALDAEGPIAPPFEDLVGALPTIQELAADTETRLSQQRNRLRRLGPVNPEAKTEYDTESTRYEFMSTQVQDLRSAESDLRRVIDELDELTRQEFSRTFEAVDKQFRAIFTRLFGGGSASLSLTDPDNLVETGIEIEARLPGRRSQGLSLLSGGERSLTAIALVFALLKVSPTPVCVMDEVDAMLDEANVGRFRDLLSDLSKDTQFIVITHNRNTVQAADVIYGITMGRDSTSQIISLRLDQVSEEMLGTGQS
jgi:chromosome segregation protein